MRLEVLIASFACLFLVTSYANAQQSCVTPDDQPGKCINIYQCQVFLAKFRQQNLSSEQLSFLQKFWCGTEDNWPNVCCPNSNNISDYNNNFPKTAKLIKRRRCGERLPDGVINGIRVNENQAKFGEFPWMVAILRKYTAQKREILVYQGGGSLIHPRAVLTSAGHGVVGYISVPAKNLSVRAGEWDMRTSEESFPRQDRQVKNVIVHEKYYHGSPRNDYAILILSEPVKLTEAVNVICLPEKHMQFDHSRCWVNGWGQNVYGHDGKEGRYQAILKKIDLPIVDVKSCLNLYRSFFTAFDDSIICAGGELGKGPCMGDGGSPLVCPMQNDPHRYYQAGILSWGVGCGLAHPGLYANVATARDWIDHQLNVHGLDNSYYVNHST